MPGIGRTSGGSSGGARVGAGRPKKDVAKKVLEGSARLPERRAAVAPLPPVDEFDAPNDLTTDERMVWLDLAPHAFQARTLTRASGFAFKLLCRNVLLERELSKNVEQKGGANHRGMIQQITAGLLRFKLSPMGKPMVEEAPKVADPFDEFEHVH